MSIRTRRSAWWAGAVVLLAACTSADPAPQDDAAVKASTPEPITQQQVEQAVQGFVQALRSGDATQTPTYCADDATFLSARGKIDTGANITAFWTEAVKGNAGKDLELHPLKWGSSGDLAWSLSHYVGGITAPRGHVLAVMQRQADGSLKIVAQVSIPEPPAK
jgi:ketosteroid isomerase-like protein